MTHPATTDLIFNIYPDQRKGGLQLFITHLFDQGHYLPCGLTPQHLSCKIYCLILACAIIHIRLLFFCFEKANL